MKQAIDYENLVMTHRYSGNGYIVVYDLPGHGEYVLVTGTRAPETGRQFFLAWRALLAPWLLPKSKLEPDVMVTQPIPAECREEIDSIRAHLKSGRYKVVNTRMVPA